MEPKGGTKEEIDIIAIAITSKGSGERWKNGGPDGYSLSS